MCHCTWKDQQNGLVPSIFMLAYTPEPSSPCSEEINCLYFATRISIGL